MLGHEGANTLAEVIRVNRVLQELHCAYNSIPLSGFTDMVNALRDNTSLIYLPSMVESRQEHLNQAKAEVKAIKEEQQTHQRSYRRAGQVAAGLVVPGKFGAIIRNPKSIMPTSKDLPKASAAPLTEQDIGAALRLVDENWERQAYKLSQYLMRNSCILNGIDVPIEIEDEGYEKEGLDPDLLKLLEEANFNRTPTLELTDPMLMKPKPQPSKKGWRKRDSILTDLEGAFGAAKQNMTLSGLTSFGSSNI